MNTETYDIVVRFSPHALGVNPVQQTIMQMEMQSKIVRMLEAELLGRYNVTQAPGDEMNSTRLVDRRTDRALVTVAAPFSELVRRHCGKTETKK